MDMQHHTMKSSMPGMEQHNTNHSMMGMSGMNNTSCMKMVMQMYFTAGKEVTLFFESWHIETVGALFGACIGLFVIAILYEGLKMYRQNLLLKPVKLMVGDVSETNTESTLLKNGKNVINRFSKRHFLQTFLHMVQVFVGYLLMLAFMTYNVWICIAVILGAGAGYFLFAVKPILFADSDHCN